MRIPAGRVIGFLPFRITFLPSGVLYLPVADGALFGVEKGSEGQVPLTRNIIDN